MLPSWAPEAGVALEFPADWESWFRLTAIAHVLSPRSPRDESSEEVPNQGGDDGVCSAFGPSSNCLHLRTIEPHKPFSGRF
jgi:hypothetical protein